MYIFVRQIFIMMLKRIFILSLVIFCNTVIYGQKKEKIKGDRNVTIMETPINSFNKIIVGENFNVDIIEGDNASIFIESDDNLHSVIKFTVADSTLSIQTTKKITSFKQLSIKVIYTNTLKEIETVQNGEISSLTSIDLNNITLKSSGNSRAFLNIKSESFNLNSGDRSRVKLNLTTALSKFEMSDNSKLDALINADSMNIDLYQRSDAKVRGNLQTLKVRADNASNLEGKELVSKNCNVLSEATSDVAVNVTNNLVLDVSGSGEIYIYDEPKITINRFTNTAKLHKKEIKK